MHDFRFPICLLLLLLLLPFTSAHLPLVINTWPFTQATQAAWDALHESVTATATDAVVAGCTACEALQCDGTVGFGGSPDENGETTLDAMIMDGTSMNLGAVADLRRIKSAIAVAKYVMKNTEHSILAGDHATEFAKKMGFEEENLTTEKSEKLFKDWKENSCQPNYWTDVFPNPEKMCGPYHPQDIMNQLSEQKEIVGKSSFINHDTISMVIVDRNGNVVSGTSTNGASHKIPGRVGDGPIVGAGGYADSEVGGCGATGDGDLMMRFLPCYQAIESLRQNKNWTPQQAAEDALMRIGRRFPRFNGGIVVADNRGNYGAAGWGWQFSYSVRTTEMSNVSVIKVDPIGPFKF